MDPTPESPRMPSIATPPDPPVGAPADTDTVRRLRDMESLLDISRAMTAEKDLDRLLALIMSAATRLMHADRSSLFLVDEAKQELVSRIAQKTEVKELRFPVGKGVAGSVAAAKQLVNIPDAYGDHRFNPEFDRRTGFRTRAILCAPLLTSEGRLIGVIQVLNKAHGNFTHYDEDLIMALGSQAAVVLDNARLVQHYLEKQKIEQSLSLARDIQQDLLPKQPPTHTALEMACRGIMCDETGGDYYDFIPLSEGRLGLVIGDVSGHGIASALLMAATRATLRALAQTVSDPGQILFQLNNLLCADLDGTRFVTLFYGVLSADGRSLRYASAGHDAPLVYRPAADRFVELDSTGLPLGILAESAFETGPELALSRGDILLLTTDGVWEAMDPAEEPFGRERLQAVVREHKEAPCTGLLDVILEAVSRHCGEAAQRDDISLCAIRTR